MLKSDNTDSFYTNDCDNISQSNIQSQQKYHSILPDLATGWRPKNVKIAAPIFVTYEDTLGEHAMRVGLASLTKLIYIGPRHDNSYKFHSLTQHTYNIKYGIKCDEVPQKLKKQLEQFTMKSNNRKGLFAGMNPNLQKQLMFQSNFESGNLDLVTKVSPTQYNLFLKPDTNTRGHMQWFYFKITNANYQHQKVKFNICNNRKSGVLFCRGMKPYVYSKYVQSSKGIKWQQCGQNISYKRLLDKQSNFLQELKACQLENEVLNKYFCLSFQYTFQSCEDEVYFAYCPPFTYSDMKNHLQQLKKKSNSQNGISVTQQTLCTSLTGLQIPIITIKDDRVEDAQKRCIVATARFHPGQSNGSHVIKGFMDYLVSPQAQYLRERITFKIIPMVNPDGVVFGNYRTSLSGKDLNRKFKTKNNQLFPQTTNLKNFVLKLKREQKQKIMYFLDFHGHSIKKNVFLYGPQYDIWSTKFERAKILPKIIATKTNMFRYQSCLFRVAATKKTTARAFMLGIIPYCYTIESSVGIFRSFTERQKQNIFFDVSKFEDMGKVIGESLSDAIFKINREGGQNKKKKKSMKVQQPQQFIKTKIMKQNSASMIKQNLRMCSEGVKAPQTATSNTRFQSQKQQTSPKKYEISTQQPQNQYCSQMRLSSSKSSRKQRENKQNSLNSKPSFNMFGNTTMKNFKNPMLDYGFPQIKEEEVQSDGYSQGKSDCESDDNDFDKQEYKKISEFQYIRSGRQKQKFQDEKQEKSNVNKQKQKFNWYTPYIKSINDNGSKFKTQNIKTRILIKKNCCGLGSLIKCFEIQKNEYLQILRKMFSNQPMIIIYALIFIIKIENMEIQGMTLLADLKNSIRKRLYREVVKKIERKIQKDSSFQKNNNILQILYQQIEAVHGLLQQVIIGRFDKCSAKVDTLVKIMNRNLKICSRLLKYKMGSGQYLDLKVYKLSSFIEDYRTVKNKKNFQIFLQLLLNSCYYIHMLRVFAGHSNPQFEPYIKQCQRLIGLLSQMSKSNFKIQLIISKLLILLMSINIKQKNKNQATLQFYQALSHLLIALKILENKGIQDIRLYRRYKKSILILITIAFINYQTMQIQEGNFVGWETGFGVVKAIEKELRGQQNSWAKYLRAQYDKDQQMVINKMDQIRKIYLPFLTDQSEVINEIMKAAKNSKKGCFKQTLLVEAKNKNLRQNWTHGRNHYSSKLQSAIPFFEDQSKQFDTVQNSKIKSNYNIQLSNTQEGSSNIKKSRFTNRKNILKASKFPSIDWLQSIKIKSNVSEFFDTIVDKSDDDNIEKNVMNKKIPQQIERSNQQHKTQRRQKRNMTSAKIVTEYGLKFQKQQSKKKRRQTVLHRLITSEDRESNKATNSCGVSPSKFNKSLIKGQVSLIQNDRKSFQHCLTDVFIKMLIQNKHKLKIKSLVNSYQLTKKRRKIRNYNLQILQLQLHKSISNMVTTGMNETWFRKKKSPKQKYTSIAKIIKNDFDGKENNFFRRGLELRQHQNSQNQSLINQKQIECSHNRSKQVIRGMLKKITARNTKAKLKNSTNNGFYSSQLFLSYRPME